MNKNKSLLFLLFIFLGFTSYSQFAFEKGYFINNSGDRIECLIKNLDWRNNPKKIEYKLNSESATETVFMEGIQEFGINNGVKFVRSFVEMDRSSNQEEKMSYKKNPEFRRERLLLKVLIEGEAILYSYGEASLSRFFYKTQNSEIKQLVFKSYKTSDNKVAKNEEYKSELWENLKCTTILLEDIQNLEYNKRSLSAYFIKYHECNGLNFSNFDLKQKRNLLALSIRPGIRLSSINFDHETTNSRDIDFGSQMEFRIGAEIEFFLPFASNKYAIILEPTFRSVNFSKDQELPLQSGTLDYASIEVPFGFRQYFFLGESSKIMLNALAIFDIPFDPILDYSNSADLDLRSEFNFALGLGYRHKNKYSLELRYGFERSLEDINFTSKGGYQTIELIVGYRIL